MIKKVLLLILLFSSYTGVSIAYAAIGYHLDLQLQPAQHQLEATVSIDLKTVKDRQLQLRLASTATIYSIRQDSTDLNYQFSNGLLVISLKNNNPIQIKYSAVFHDPVPTTPVHTENPGFGVSATISPEGTYLSAGVAWYPQINAENVHYNIRVSAPGHTEAITSGKRLYRYHDGTYSISAWEIDYPVRGLTLSAGPYQVFEDITGSVPIFAYFYQDSAELALTYLKKSRYYLDLYERLFGPYPFPHFAVVENFFPTGFGLPGWTLLGSTVIRLPFIVTTSLGHEIAHSWWGNGVWVDFRQGNWSEGLTTYVADHLYQEHSGEDDARSYRLNHLMTYANLTNSANRFAVQQFMYRSDRPGQAIGYGKAMMIFHMLRREVGDDIFWQTLREITTENMFTHIGWNHFSERFSANTGRDMAPFFQQWLSRTDDPQIGLDLVTVQQTDTGWLTRGTLQQLTPPYQLHVKIRLNKDQQQHNETIDLHSDKHEFSIFTPWRPERISVDPDVDLFRLMDPAEIPSTVASIRGSKNLKAVVANRLLPPIAARQTLLAGLRQNRTPVIAAERATSDELSRHDLLIFGVDDRLIPNVEMDLHLKEFLARDKDETTSTTESAGFIVTRNPFNANRHAAWFITDGSEHAVSVARRVQHYGRYGQLYFADGINQARSLDLPIETPLQIDFNHRE